MEQLLAVTCAPTVVIWLLTTVALNCGCIVQVPPVAVTTRAPFV